jgi:plasmid stabilization system protein ParE
MILALFISPEAEAQIEVINSWWHANRLAAPDLFSQELAEAFANIRAAPDAGHRYARGGFKGVRRVPLRATRHHVYYVVTHSTVHVIAVWGSVKKRGPKLVNPDE